MSRRAFATIWEDEIAKTVAHYPCLYSCYRILVRIWLDQLSRIVYCVPAQYWCYRKKLCKKKLRFLLVFYRNYSFLMTRYGAFTFHFFFSRKQSSKPFLSFLPPLNKSLLSLICLIVWWWDKEKIGVSVLLEWKTSLNLLEA